MAVYRSGQIEDGFLKDVLPKKRHIDGIRVNFKHLSPVCMLKIYRIALLDFIGAHPHKDNCRMEGAGILNNLSCYVMLEHWPWVNIFNTFTPD
jgi:hypothetical protein